ncbi:restriction endonuclease subunit S [Parabacteroides merdae]|nr:restriction endonuclease subunit S [Parabacteroides merdae]MDB9098828.1 restriction endonuclease subunit S [Parabacteroides merdae]MDB9110429.1 restriction endonuclease subunit S [Parabacteroides merdae]
MPESWVWTNIEELFFVTKLAGFEYTDYFTKDTISSNNEVPIVRAQNVRMGYFVENTNEAISEALSQQLERSALTKECLLMTFIGAGIGDTCIFPALKRCHLAPNVAKIEPYSNKIDLKYGLYYLMSDLGQLGVRGISKSTAQPSLSMATIRSLDVALPPLTEQYRIVAEIEKWFELIDQIEQGKSDLQTTIKQTKSKILDLAIHGKLVPQDPNDEPAIELLKRISPDFTPCDNGHYTFEIPKSWMWCKLGDIAQSNIGLTYKPTDITDNGIPVYRSNNIRDRKIDKSDLVRVNAPILEKQFLNIGDLLICVRNGSRRLIGKCAIIEELDEATSFGAFMAVCRSEYNQWIFNLLNTIYFDRYLDDSNSTAINQITQRMLLALPIPLPPLAEQQRIVQKIEELFSVLDNIQNALEV